MVNFLGFKGSEELKTKLINRMIAHEKDERKYLTYQTGVLLNIPRIGVFVDHIHEETPLSEHFSLNLLKNIQTNIDYENFIKYVLNTMTHKLLKENADEVLDPGIVREVGLEKALELRVEEEVRATLNLDYEAYRDSILCILEAYAPKSLSWGGTFIGLLQEYNDAHTGQSPRSFLGAVL